MSRGARLSWWQLVVVLAVAGAAIAFVVTYAVGVVSDGAGTGDPADFYRAVGRELTDPTTWRVTAVGALVGAVGGGVAALLGGRSR
ncbi:hypothetical protein [Isoptericola aurantiacus]|uniref:hypothetical protein n=1 Tax=Isoptericola aurantiacus TaxID=3377839 RepID=UPI00383AB947